MAHLTDIRTPNYYNRAPQPPKKSFFKRFFKWVLVIILAPITLPWRALVFIVRGIKNFLTTIVVWLKRSLVATVGNIKNTLAATAVWLSNFFVTVIRNTKNRIFRLTPNNWAGWLVLLLAVGLLFQIAITTNIFSFLNFPNINSGKWQAVFLQNSQVYFGHLKKANGEYAVLENVYYLRTPTGGQTAANLVKLGNELHGPEDTMFIPNNQISFWENLRNDSQVVKLIQQIEAQ